MAQPKDFRAKRFQSCPASGGKPLFGPAPERPAAVAANIDGRLERLANRPAPSLAKQLSERLAEKYRNYERAALRLELRGEHDAAKLLRAAAERVKLLRPAGEDTAAARD